MSRLKKIILSLLLGGLIIFPHILKGQENFNSPYYSFPRNKAQRIDLVENWKLSYTQDTISSPEQLTNVSWINVAQPTSVHMAMFKAGKLPDPYVGLNSLEYKKLEQKIWYYKKHFTITEEHKGKHVILSFDGIDYFSKIWLNGKLLGYHEGMHGGPAIDITHDVLYDDENELVVQVKSANYQNPDFMPRRPGKIIKTWFFTGGSGVEPFFHLGMWRGAYINVLSNYHIERPFLSTKEIRDNRAILSYQLEVFHEKTSLDYTLHPWGNSRIATHHSPIADDVPQRVIPQENLKVVIELSQEGKVHYRKELTPELVQGRSWLEGEWEINNPKLWFPNGMGEQNLYVANVKLELDNQLVDEITFDFGIRKIDHVRSAGARTQDRWADWQFVINGKKEFVKGMNWMPIDALSNLTVDKYEWLIKVARNAGVQMFRVWGSGYVETKEFYDLCNRYGIMVWQDFPIANFDTPDWALESWEELVCRNIFRLRNEPSLVVWCGGNEFNPYSLRTTAVMGVLERNLKEFDPTRLFLRASPDAGSMHSYPDFDPNWYKGFKLIPFVAETGIHCMTDARGNREVIDKSEFFGFEKMADSTFSKDHPQFVHHFVEYEPFRVPRMLSRATHINDISKISYEEMVEATQIGAGEFYQVMSEGFQSNYPVTTGLMPWTFNRPWPTVAAINLVDGFGHPTAPYYFLKNTYSENRIMLDLPRLLWRSNEKIPLKVKVLNMGLEKEYTAHITVKVYDQRFKEVLNQQKSVFVAACSHVVDLAFNEFVIPSSAKNEYFFLVAESKDDQGKLISQAVYWPRTIPQMEDEKFYNKFLSTPVAWPSLNNGPWLKPSVANNKTTLSVGNFTLEEFDGVTGELSYTIQNTGKHPAFMCAFEIEQIKRIFYASDNFFWLNAGESKKVKVSFRLREELLRNQLVFNVSSWNAKTVIKKVKVQ